MCSLDDYDMKVVHIEPDDIIFVQLDQDHISDEERKQIEHVFRSTFHVRGVLIATKKVEVTILRNDRDWVGEILDESKKKDKRSL